MIPAPALAVDQRLPKASPADDDLAAGLLPYEGADELEGFAPDAEEKVLLVDAAGTEVK